MVSPGDELDDKSGQKTEAQQNPFGELPSAQRHNPVLRWTDPSGTSQAARIDGQAVVGAAPDVEITIDDPAVSRLHAELELREDGVWVTDLGSLNGTYVENVRVSSARLDEGLRLSMGSTALALQYDSQASPVELWPVDRYGSMVGRSVLMRELFVRMSRAAESDATVLVQGETGTGKELVASAIHEASGRVDGPLVVVDCGAIQHGLLEAELFGHVRGSFTGATTDRAGAVEAAHGGTLFLDEVGELPLSVQPKLLRLLETRTVSRVGEAQTRTVDVRFIAATNRDLRAMVNEGAFREDLYFRLAVLHLSIAPLRRRLDDIPLLIEHFMPDGAAPPPAELLVELKRRPWPGNARELRNFVERAIALGTEEALGDMPASSSADGLPTVALDRPFKQLRDQWISHLERDYLSGQLERHGGNVSAVAKASGLNRTYIHRLIRKHEL